MDRERRASPRQCLALPIALADGTAGMTRDISVSGLFFTVPTGRKLAKWIHVEFSARWAGLKFSATGQVVRVKRGKLEDGVALRLHAPHLSPLH